MEVERTIVLRKPISIGDLSYDKLQLAEPTAAQLERASSAGNSVGVVITLISEVAKVPRPAVECLCQRDFRDAADFFAQFGDVSRLDGEMSSLNSPGSTGGAPAMPGA
jgi:hypothetical protein